MDCFLFDKGLRHERVPWYPKLSFWSYRMEIYKVAKSRGTFRIQSNFHNASVIRQKSECQNGCFKKTKHTKFAEKRTFFAPWYAHVRVRNVRFSGNLACFVFLKHPFWDSPFCLITDEISSSVFINPFHTTGVFPYLLKISEYVRGSPDIFGEYMMRPVFWNKLNEDKSQILNTSLASESNKTNARRKE